jgi:hypothetical protein
MRVFVIFCGIVGFGVLSLSGQTVVAIASQDKELKRTAHQLHISVDHLVNARAALKEASDLARHSSDSSIFYQLAVDWEKIDKSRAQPVLEDLYTWLRTGAADAPDTAAYEHFTASARSLIQWLVGMDYDRAVVLWRHWPDPPAALGDAFQKAQIQSNAQYANHLPMLAAASNQADLTQLREAAANGDFTSASMLAARLNQAGERADSLKVVDQTIADFARRPPDSRSIATFLFFVRTLSPIDPDRFLQATNLLRTSIDKQGDSNAGGTLTAGNQSIKVSASEAAIIELCRSLNGRPDLAARTLNSVPGLRAKLDQVGGIDSIAGNPVSGLVNANYSIDGVTRTTYSRTPGGSAAGGTSAPGAAGASVRLDLYQSLRGKLAKNPDFVRQKLAEASRDPEQIDSLLALAAAATAQEPDLASLALEAASKLVARVDPLQKRAVVMQNLIGAYQRCDGEVDAEVLQAGLVVVQQLRDEGKNTSMPTPTATGAAVVKRASPADQLEMTIVTQLALTDYVNAMHYLRLMPEDMRLQTLLQIVRSLSQGY